MKKIAATPTAPAEILAEVDPKLRPILQGLLADMIARRIDLSAMPEAGAALRALAAEGGDLSETHASLADAIDHFHASYSFLAPRAA